MMYNISDIETIQYTILKSLIKETIKEIYQRPRRHFNDPNVVNERLTIYLSQIREGTQIYLRHLIQNEYGEANRISSEIRNLLNIFENIFSQWAIHTNENNFIKDMGLHINELHRVTILIIEALKEHNYIIIKKDVQRLYDIFDNMSLTLKKLFESKV